MSDRKIPPCPPPPALPADFNPSAPIGEKGLFSRTTESKPPPPVAPTAYWYNDPWTGTLESTNDPKNIPQPPKAYRLPALSAAEIATIEAQKARFGVAANAGAGPLIGAIGGLAGTIGYTVAAAYTDNPDERLRVAAIGHGIGGLIPIIGVAIGARVRRTEVEEQKNNVSEDKPTVVTPVYSAEALAKINQMQRAPDKAPPKAPLRYNERAVRQWLEQAKRPRGENDVALGQLKAAARAEFGPAIEGLKELCFSENNYFTARAAADTLVRLGPIGNRVIAELLSSPYLGRAGNVDERGYILIFKALEKNDVFAGTSDLLARAAHQPWLPSYARLEAIASIARMNRRPEEKIAVIESLHVHFSSRGPNRFVADTIAALKNGNALPAPHGY